MPYFNKLYSSELLEFNPLYDTDLTRDHRIENEGVQTTQNTGSETTSDADETTSSFTNTRSTTENGSGQTTNTETNTTNKTEWDLYSDTPQGGVTGLDNNNYLTNARKISNNESLSINGSGTTNETKTANTTDGGSGRMNASKSGSKNTSDSGTANITNTEDYIEHVRGKNGGVSYSKMLQEFRETFLNIDKMVIDSLEDLFFGLW